MLVAEQLALVANENARPLGAKLCVLALDIDGVLTDGTEGVSDANEAVAQKRIALRDLDALTRARQQGVRLALVTGEKGALVARIARRVGADVLVAGAKDKLSGLKEVCDRLHVGLDEICFVGDAERDALAFPHVGLSCAPKDASVAARQRASYCLDSCGGRGAVAEAVEIFLRQRSLDGADQLAKAAHILAESLEAHQQMAAQSGRCVASIAQLLIDCLRRGGKILFCGNGGSAADAQHAAAELVGRFAYNRAPLPALSLTTDTSVLTAVANDWAYEDVFSRQVRALAQPGDAVVGLSTSGNSKNIEQALLAAKEKGAYAIALTGQRSGIVTRGADVCLAVPTTSTPRIQELHILALHAVCDLVESSLFPQTQQPDSLPASAQPKSQTTEKDRKSTAVQPSEL